jgi:PAS domain S-box-containing protein
MKSPLRILHLEDNLNDAALVQATLESEGIACAITRAQTRADFVAALERGSIDLIIADFSLPTFDGLTALKITQKQCPEIPFILVSGTLGEETAVTAMRSGAADYLLKDRLTRLGQAVSHALKESRLRKERDSADEAMRQSEHKYRHLFESLSEAAFLIDAKSRRIIDANLCAEKLLGRTRTEILGMNEARLFPLNEAAEYCGKLANAGTRGKGDLDEAEIQSKDGTTIPVRVSLTSIELYGHDLVLALMTDITERLERRQLDDVAGKSLDFRECRNTPPTRPKRQGLQQCSSVKTPYLPHP